MLSRRIARAARVAVGLTPALLGFVHVADAATPVPTATIANPTPTPHVSIPTVPVLATYHTKILAPAVRPTTTFTKISPAAIQASVQPTKPTPGRLGVIASEAVLGVVSKVSFSGTFATGTVITMGVDMASPAPANGSYFLLANDVDIPFLSFSQHDQLGRGSAWTTPIVGDPSTAPVDGNSWQNGPMVAIHVPPGATHVDVHISTPAEVTQAPYSLNTYVPYLYIYDATPKAKIFSGYIATATSWWSTAVELIVWPRDPTSVTTGPAALDLQGTNLWQTGPQTIHVAATYPTPATGRGLCFDWPWISANHAEGLASPRIGTFETLSDPANASLFRIDTGPMGWCAIVQANNTVSFDLAVRMLPQNANLDSSETLLIWDRDGSHVRYPQVVSYHSRKVRSVTCQHTSAPLLGVSGPSVTCTATLDQAAPTSGYQVIGLRLNNQIVPPLVVAPGATSAFVTMPNAGAQCQLAWDNTLKPPFDRDANNQMIITMPSTVSDIMRSTSLSCH